MSTEIIVLLPEVLNQSCIFCFCPLLPLKLGTDAGPQIQVWYKSNKDGLIQPKDSLGLCPKLSHGITSSHGSKVEGRNFFVSVSDGNGKIFGKLSGSHHPGVSYFISPP